MGKTMASYAELSHLRRNRASAQLASAIVCVVGYLGLLGWVLNVQFLKNVAPGLALMKPNLALGLMLCGIALALLTRKSSPKWVQHVATSLSILVILLGALTLGEYLFDRDLGIDHWLWHDIPGTGTSHAGRLAPSTALCFVLMGSALLTGSHSIPPRLRIPLVGGLSAALMVIGALALVGFVLETLFGGSWNYMGMNVSGVLSAMAFMFLGSGLLEIVRSEGALSWLLDGLTTAGFALGILLMVLAAAVAFDFTKRMLKTTVGVSHTQEILKEIEKIKSNMVDLESGQRGYIITGDEEMLAGRGKSKTNIRQGLASLRNLTADDRDQQRQLDKFEPLMAERDDWEEQSISIRAEQGFLAAQQQIVTGKGVALWKSCRQLLEQMEDAEYALLDTWREQSNVTSRMAFLLLPLGTFLSLAILSLGLFFLNAGVRERTAAEEGLRQSEAQLHTIVENLDEGVVVSDLNGKLLQWNRAALKLHGYSSSDQDRRRFTELIDTFELSTLDGALVPMEQWPLARILRDKRLHDIELRVRRVGSDWQRIFNYGGTLVRDANNRPLLAIVTISDITERKRTEEVRAQLAAIVESSDDAIVSKNLEGIITSWNLGAEKLFGYSTEEAIGKSMLMLFPPERVGEESEILRRIRQGVRIDHFETVRVTKDGKQIDVSVTLSPIRDGQGRIIGASKIARDITDRKRAEEEIRQLNVELEERVVKRTAELEAANKELEAFSYSVSHDLRSPLRTVDGFSQAVLEDYGGQLPDEGRRYLQTIREGAQRMGVLIDDLLTFSRLSRLPLHKETVDTGKLVRDSLEGLDSERRRRQIKMSIGKLPPCHGDPALLKQVWINLLSNAVKYTRKRETAVIEIGCQSGTGEAIYFVRDNGTGFDMQYAAKLFGVFQRLHRTDEFEGTGVGLAIVQRVVHRHGGRVWAEAAVDHGATFYFTLEGTNHV